MTSKVLEYTNEFGERSVLLSPTDISEELDKKYNSEIYKPQEHEKVISRTNEELQVQNQLETKQENVDLNEALQKIETAKAESEKERKRLEETAREAEQIFNKLKSVQAEKQEPVSSSLSSKIETNIQNQEDLKQVVDQTTSSLEQQKEAMVSPLPSSVDTQIKEQEELKQAVGATNKAAEQADISPDYGTKLDDTIQKVKELEQNLDSLNLEKVSKVPE